MIIGIGTDIVEVDRVCRACEKEAFLRRCYTDAERELIKIKKGRAATHFAAKEAVSKMFGTGFGEVRPTEVEILRNQAGAPYVVLHEKALEKGSSMGIQTIHITLSDTNEHAVAFVVGEGEQP